MRLGESLMSVSAAGTGQGFGSVSRVSGRPPRSFAWFCYPHAPILKNPASHGRVILKCSNFVKVAKFAAPTAVSSKSGAPFAWGTHRSTMAGSPEKYNTRKGNTSDAILDRVATLPVPVPTAGGAVAGPSQGHLK